MNRLIILILLFTFQSFSVKANLTCENLYSESIKRTEIHDVESFGKAMTEGMLLQAEQADIFDVYLKMFFGDPNTELNGKTLKSVLDILKVHPELEKIMFTEFLISTVEKVYSNPKELENYIKSQSLVAAEVRNNLFQIDANLGYWKRLLDYKDQELPEHLKSINLGKNATDADRIKAREINKARSDWQTNNQLKFIKYLNRIIKKTNRELLADLKNENTTYKAKAQALFKTLEYLESWMSKNNRNTKTIRQALVDLVYSVGYGNQSSLDLLKSDNALDKIQGLSQLWSEADGFAEELGFKNHFLELKDKMQIEFPTGLSKNQDPEELINIFKKIVLLSNYSTRPTSTVRVRSLSIQEAAFRSCLGKDCSSRTYFDKALDPNYIYFTMTDENHKSDGHATLVLGTARNKETGEDEKVAFLDKLQNIPTQKIEMFLNAIHQSLQTKGYQLAIPTYLGRDIPGHGGLSNTNVITDFVETNIKPRLSKIRELFSPHQHNYQFHNAYSRGDQKLEVRIFESHQLDEETQIRKGNEVHTYKAESTLSKEQLIQSVLKLKVSENPDDLIKFISLSDRIIKMGLYSKDQLYRDLNDIVNDLKKPLKVRKQAAYQTVFLFDTNKLFSDFLGKLTEQEFDQVIREIISYDQSENPKLRKLIDKLTEPIMIEWIINNCKINNKIKVELFTFAIFKNADQNKPTNFAWLINQSGINLNAKDNRGNTALHWAAFWGWNYSFEWLIKQPGVDLNARDHRGKTALHWSISLESISAFDWLIKQPGVDLNSRDNENRTALHWASFRNSNSYSKYFFDLLIKQPGIDLNARDNESRTALHWAGDHGWNDSFEWIIKQPSVDLNAKDDQGRTALYWAVGYYWKDAFEWLTKQPGVDLNAKLKGNKTLIFIIIDCYWKEAFEWLIKQPGVDLNTRNSSNETAIDIAKSRGWE